MTTYWRALASAPYRPFFLAGALQAAIAMLTWLVLLTGRLNGYAPDLPLPQGWLHVWLMFFGTFPFFVTGFTLTAVPNWLGEAGVPAGEYRRAFRPMATGAALVYPALWIGTPFLLVAIALHWTGWAMATATAWRIVARSRHPGKRHFYMAIAVIAAGLIAEIVFAASLLEAEPRRYALARDAALWLFLLPTFFSISHRIVPAFTRMALPGVALDQPLWMLPGMTLLCLVHFGLAAAELPGWLWLADLPLCVMALLLSWRWDSLRYARHPLIGIQHLSFAWLGIALVMYVAQSLGVPLGLAPLHALVAGYFGSMLLGMAARVTVAHAGGAIEFPPLLRRTFLIYQAVPLLRVAADLPDMPQATVYPLYFAAALLWLFCWLVWLWLMAPLLGRSTAG